MSLEERLLEQARACEYGTWNMAAALLREAAEANRELVEGLRVFAVIEPSSLYAADGSEVEGYVVRLYDPTRQAGESDFTGADLARARALIAKMEGR